MSKRNKKVLNQPSFLAKYQSLILVSILVVFGFVIYSNTYQNSFHFDDNFYITNNHLVKDIGVFTNLRYWTNIHFRPIPTFSFALQYKLHGFELAPFHLFNNIIHFLSAILVFFLTQFLLRLHLTTANKQTSKNLYIPFIVAAIFISHPLQTQSVNYIVQRMSSMAALFYLLSVFTYLKARWWHINGKVNRGILFYIITAIAFILAILSKQTAATIPFSLLLVEILFVRNNKGQLAKTYVYSFAAVLLAVVLFGIIGGYIPREYDLISRDIYLATQFNVVLKYISLFFLPYPLNFDPDIPLATSFFGGMEILMMLVHLFILGLGVYLYKKNKLITFGIFWFYITLAVESSIIPIRDVMFEHRMYLPIYGLIISVVAAIFEFTETKLKSSSLMMAFTALIFVYSMMTYQRNKVWASDYSLWLDVSKKSPEKSRSYQYLGVEFTRKGEWDKALKSLQKAIEYEPGRWQEYCNVGAIYQSLNDNDKALKFFNKSIEKGPDESRIYIYRAKLYLKIGEVELSKNDIDKAIELDQSNGEAYMIRADYFIENEEFKLAKRDLDRAIAISSDLVLPLYKRGLVYFNLGNYQECINDFTELFKRRSNLSDAYLYRGNAFFNIGNYQNALLDYSHLLSLKAGNVKALKARGLTYYQLGNYELAKKDLDIAKSKGEYVEPQVMIDISKKLTK